MIVENNNNNVKLDVENMDKIYSNILYLASFVTCIRIKKNWKEKGLCFTYLSFVHALTYYVFSCIILFCCIHEYKLLFWKCVSKRSTSNVKTRWEYL